MRFGKYQGLGNDFILFADPHDELKLSEELVRKLCDRRLGIGADGVIRAGSGRGGAELFMDYFNSDGSIGEMCGNGIRCLALFALAEGLTTSVELEVATRSGVKSVLVEGDRVRVDMGLPIFEPAQIPVRWRGRHALHAKVETGLGVFEVACLSMGNPHAVALMEDEAPPIAEHGPLIERHEMFPNGTNVELVRVLSPDRMKMWVWERGAGETRACGTGACAAAVASRLLAGTKEEVVVELPGGELEIEWEGSLDRQASVVMTGPASRSFEGEVDLEAYAIAGALVR